LLQTNQLFLSRLKMAANPHNVIVGEFHGDGQYLQNVARVVANGTNDYLVSIGANADSLVGEPNLRFNGSRLFVHGAVTASTMHLTSFSAGQATTSSFLALDVNNNIILTSSAGGPRLRNCTRANQFIAISL
jgi:hypothetical protein